GVRGCVMGEVNGFSRPAPAAEPVYRGYRMVRRAGPDGARGYERVPLTRWDVLHPQEGDVIMHGPTHDADRHYLRDVFSLAFAGDPAAVVYHDVGVYWADPA